VEWFVSHALWDFVVAAIASVVVSIGGARLMHAAADTAFNLFLLAVGVLGVLWGIGLLPIRKIKNANLRESLKAECDELIVGWQELAELYQNSEKQTLQGPIDPRWASAESKFIPYKVGFLQGRTIELRRIVKSMIPIEGWDANLSMPALLHALKRYSDSLT
jgi:hypothetical protein